MHYRSNGICILFWSNVDQSVGFSIFWLMILCSCNIFIYKCWLYTDFSTSCYIIVHLSIWTNTNCKCSEKIATYYFRDELTVLKCLAATVQRVRIIIIYDLNLNRHTKRKFCGILVYNWLVICLSLFTYNVK